MDSSESKWCNRCKRDVPLTEWYPQRKNGRRGPHCRQCMKANAKAKRENAPSCVGANDATKARFMKSVQPAENGCHIWTASRNGAHYGQFWYVGRMRSAHKAAYEMWVGPVPDGLFVLHKCDNPPCVNIDHLYAGTAKENAHDRDSRGRAVILSGEDHWMRKHPELIRRGFKVPESAIQRGSQQWRSVLTEEKVQELDRLHDAGWSFEALGERYGISSVAANNAYRRKTWRHVPKLEHDPRSVLPPPVRERRSSWENRHAPVGWDGAREMRRRHATGETIQAIATDFGVSLWCVVLIIKGERYKEAS